MACYDQLAPIQKSVEEVKWPFFILHGAKDRICSPEASQKFYDNAQSNDKKIKVRLHCIREVMM